MKQTRAVHQGKFLLLMILQNVGIPFGYTSYTCYPSYTSYLYQFNLEAGKAAALSHTWSGATHAPGREGRKEGEQKETRPSEANDASFSDFFIFHF